MAYKFLITGADFRNKGGQSMLFITIDELKKRFPDCVIYYPTQTQKPDGFTAETIYYDYNSLSYMNGGMDRVIAFSKAAVKKAIHKKGGIPEVFELNRLFPSLSAVIDVSGYNLSSKWSPKINERFLRYIKMARKYNIPSFIMPQSFGPFCYGKDQAKMDRQIKELMAYPEVVYAREHEGEQSLKERYDLCNVRYSCDLVLQNKGIDIHHIYDKMPKIKTPDIKKSGSIAVIPNMRSFDHGNQKKILEYYKVIIDKLLSLDKTIYLFRHASEDLEACKWIKDMYADTARVILLTEDFSCIEYDAFIDKFDFIIASRFHAIVHALRKGVPAIALGWAVKYRELMSLFGLDRFTFDLTGQLDVADMVDAVDFYHLHDKEIREQILGKLSIIQENNCFDIFNDFFN